MNILGITFGKHETAATLIKDGKLICAWKKRDLIRKHTKKFPINAIKECLKLGK